MKAANLILVLAFICILGSSVPLQVVSNNVISTSSPNILINTNQNSWFSSQNSVVFQYGQVTVPKQLYYLGLNGVAYKQLVSLYPVYKSYNINRCDYTVYGPSRIYVYVLSNSNTTVKLVSAVQNSEQSSGQQTQETVQQQRAANTQASNQNDNNTQASNYLLIKLSRAYEIPRVALAVKQVIRQNWHQIQSAPLVRCLQRWEQGVYNFRLYFDGLPTWFQYSRISNYVTSPEDLQNSVVIGQNQLTNQQMDKIKLPTSQTNNTSTDPSFLPLKTPIFGVSQVGNYQVYDVSKFRRHQGYNSIVSQYTNFFGRFDDSWISKISHKYDNQTDYFQISVKFIPFLQNCDTQVHYYGSINKAALLNIDQQVFNSNQYPQNVDTYQQVKDFNSYNQFKASNEYVLSQFTYLRLYQVVSAYSAIHKGGLYIRLVYLQKSTKNQFNVVVYKCDGQYYIDRNDFLATNLNSYGRTNWVSLFVPVTNFNAYSSFNRIVKYFKSIHPQFWTNNMVQTINLKDNLNVIFFKNPTSNSTNYCVLDVRNDSIAQVNHFNWTLVGPTSPFYTKAFQYVSSKYNVSSQMFIHFNSDPYGQHYEVSYLNDQQVFCNAYLRWIPLTGVFIQDQKQVTSFGINSDVVPLPQNPTSSLISFLTTQDSSIISINSVQIATNTSFTCVALSKTNRWSFNVNWIYGKWVVRSKTPIIDGYFKVSGYPSLNVASCTGYLSKIYPSAFANRYLYTFVQVKNIGYFVYNRISYNIRGVGYQAVVRTTYGVDNSQTLISWDQSHYCKDLDDYGYGSDYTYNYGYQTKYFYDLVDTPLISSASASSASSVTVTTSQVNVTVTTLDQTDLLCSYWSGSVCLSCYGDYYANDQGKCVKIENACQFWTLKGLCLTCAYGWSVNSSGQCVMKSVTTITIGV